MIVGKNDSTGPVPALINELPQPHWKTATTRPKDAPAAKHVHRRRGERNDDASEGHHQQQTPEQDDHADEQRDLGREDLREVDEDRGEATDVDPRMRLGVAAGM